jgi:hypothetical protein
MLKVPDFKQSPETQIIHDLFRALPLRDPPLITFRELCEATGKSRAEIRGAIATALGRALSVDRLVIDNEHNVGYRLRPNAEIPASSQNNIARARRATRKAQKKLSVAEPEKMPGPERIDFYVQSSLVEMTLMSTRPRTVSNVRQMALRKQNELSNDEMLDAIKQALARA